MVIIAIITITITIKQANSLVKVIISTFKVTSFVNTKVNISIKDKVDTFTYFTFVELASYYTYCNLAFNIATDIMGNTIIIRLTLMIFF